MSIEVMRSPTRIESMTSMPEVTWPKWLYTPLVASDGASPVVMKNCEPLTPAALEAIPAVPRGHLEGLVSLAACKRDRRCRCRADRLPGRRNQAPRGGR